MKQPLLPSTLALGWALLACLACSAPAQVLQDLSQELYSTDSTERGVNYNSLRGSPGKPPASPSSGTGSDGRLVNQTETASLNQFRGIVTYGAVVLPKRSATLVAGKNFEQNAGSANLNLPRGETGGQVVYVLRASQAGAPTFGRLSSYNFGAVISPPLLDESGNLLTQPNTYWAVEPYSTNGHVTIGATATPAGYYFSPHAQMVFATQPGPIEVVWRKAEPAVGTLSGLNKVTLGGLDYAVTNASYVVSGVAAKTPRKLYWTEKTFRATGKAVAVPTARVGAIYFHYNSAFPRTNAVEFAEIGSSSFTEGSTNAALQELRTAWYDNGQGLILAYNKEGRVFLELLGDPTGGNARQHLGYEILEVLKQPVPVDLTAELGEKITAYADGQPDLDLAPSPALVGVGDQFLYQDPLGSNGRTDYYAVKETQNKNDVLVHWLEAGVESLRWPLLYNRYAQVWPEDAARYSHYVRPLVRRQSEAVNTAVTLPADNAPALVYQDPLDQPRGFLNERSQFYTFLSDDQPVHRALLRFNAGERVAFERVLSVLDARIKPPNPLSGPQDFNVPGPAPGRAAFLSLTNAGATLPGEIPFNSQSFTAEAWVYLQTSSAQLFSFVVGGKTNVLNLTNQVDSLTTAFANAETISTVTLSLPLNQWSHVALVGDGTRRVLYLNGEQVGEGAAATAVSGTVTSGTLGSAGLALDEFRLWSAARVASQIQEAQTCTYLPGTSNLELQYSFNEAGTTAYDTSGKAGRDLTSLANNSLATGSPAAPGVASQSAYPRYVQATAYVGDRINPPTGELGNLTGYILQTNGTSFHPVAYQDPFVFGFEANLGAIIPVNAIQDKNILEVWWFRQNGTNAVKNAENGFKAIYWPAVIGRYTLAWPDTTASEIILASNAGSGALASLQAKGTIYTQNDQTLPGYNPNEEHAVMIGGQAYALRDDLNITSGASYSSMSYVLLDYTESDGRPAVRAFKVSREKASAGIVFDYVVEAGKQLQAPMPLPFLPAPVETITASATSVYTTNYNFETSATGGDLPVNWTNLSASAKADYTNYSRFTYRDRKQGFWVLRGLHAGLPTLAAGAYNLGQNAFVTNVTAGGAVGITFTNYIHTSRRIGSLVPTVSPTTPLPTGLTFGSLKDGLAVYGTLTANSGAYALIVTDADGSTTSVNLTLNSTASQQAALNVNSLLGRPPQLAEAAAGTNAFKMRFYYKTQEGFAWPGETNAPAVGTVVPYLRTRVGEGFTGNGKSSGDEALDIVYRPVWPANAPVVAFGETLTEANAGRPAIRGQTSAKVLYQQSIATNITVANAAVILHDPTREKVFALETNDTGLAELPATVRTESYQGKTYFPNLPPHLAERFLFDPVRGTKGSLVFKGEFKNELFGEKYLLLNVLAGSDLATVKNLCPSTDTENKSKWDTAVAGLAASVETFFENPSVPGQFIVNTNTGVTVTRGVSELIAITNDNTAVDSYALSAAGPGQGYVSVIVGDGAAFTPAGEPVSMYVLRVTGSLYRGEIKVLPSANPLNELITFEHTADLGGQFADYDYEWKIAPPVDGFPPVTDATMSRYQALTNGTDIKRYTLGGSGIQTLVDNWLVMRYRPKNAAHPLLNQWSEWSAPQLAEGWIKRVLAAINPFGQRVTDLYNNSVSTEVSLLTQAGKRYEGDIALNMENINNYGLIEIYETVLKRGKDLSIDAGVPINFGPANDALLLAAGYLNDLYMLVGNEAYADAANPTIGIGTKDKTYGDIATALFAFKGQTASLLDEELALLQGRDDVALPGVQIAPVYNRLVWNFTRGIDAGEVIYALNYNILDQDSDGKADAADAAKLYPQGHGDAYGHYLTALKGYYTLLTNPNFDWVPRVEAVTVLGQPVTVDYLDERKFASAAVAVARTGRQIYDLSWRKDYTPGRTSGWESFSTNRVSSRTVLNGTTTTNVVRHWGMDQWASRTGQGALLNWVVGNAILPEVDPDPSHEGIQKVDRTTVPELRELVTTLVDLQAASDNAEGRATPLGVTEGSIAFDLNPSQLVGGEPKPHFEQVYERTKLALNNALAAFDDAKDVTRLMRSEEDSLADLRSTLAQQELAFTNALIEIYGTAYPDDVGPGKTYKQGYEGPDLFHYAYVETPELTFGGLLNPTESVTFRLDLQRTPDTFKGGETSGADAFDFLNLGEDGTNYISYTLASHGYFEKPTSWTGRRSSPGGVQQAISDVIKARSTLLQALDKAQGAKDGLDVMVRTFKAGQVKQEQVTGYEQDLAIAEQVTANVERANELFQTVQDVTKENIASTAEAVSAALPESLIAGVAAGGDLTSIGRGVILGLALVAKVVVDEVKIARATVATALRSATDAAAVGAEFNQIRPLERTQERIAALNELANALGDVQGQAHSINQALQAYDDAQRAVSALVARGERLQAEREVTRQRTAAVVQGFRTRDAAFRIFRNEKLERYKTLFDLASRYAFLAANAYDYDTGLLGTEKGRTFVNRIVSSRALGVVRAGEPQFAGSNTGDPGISSALAEMKADYDVLKGRLGFNAPDAYNTLASLRTGNLRILPDASGLSVWQDYLQQSRMENILEDADVRRYCQQVDPGTGLPVPGIVITFSTSINPGESLFGKALAAGDGSFHRSYFATKIHSVGVALEGYKGMNYPGQNNTTDPNLSYLDPQALAANPYVYLIPVGVDTMRSPPLGDTSDLRTWKVDDVAIPLPFNIGGSGFSTKNFYQAADSLTEPLFTVRKHQAFRPTDSTQPFETGIYSGSALQFSQFTNRRLIGRSVWNTQWKLVIPGDTLLADPKEGLSRLIQTVTDIKLYFTTYSYSGN